jgi:hypothetical protein
MNMHLSFGQAAHAGRIWLVVEIAHHALALHSRIDKTPRRIRSRSRCDERSSRREARRASLLAHGCPTRNRGLL